jgi:hypothetical protein
MAGKRPIDIQRNAAVTLQIDDGEKSAAPEFLSTASGLYIIRSSSVFRIRLADDIDPGRTNPNIPNQSQQVLTAGCDNEIVARVLLTAKYLFDENNATVKPFVASLFEECIVLTRHLLELDAMTRELSDHIQARHKAFAEKLAKPNAFRLPSIPSLETDIHNILVKADKAKDSLLVLCRLRFLPDATGKPKLKELDKAVEAALQAEPELVKAWKETSSYFGLIRNMRNASEHPEENYRVVLSDFKMWPDGKVYPPLIEIQHPDTPIRSLSVTEFLEFVRDSMLAHAESMLVLIRFAVLLKNNPFGEWVAEFPEDERRHKHVRYYRALDFNGVWRILG